MNVAIVGAGAMGRAWADALTTSRLAEIAAIVDPLVGTDRSPPWLASYDGAIATTSIEELDGAVDAAVITALTPAHAELIEASLRRGLHVIVEKPLAQTIAEAERVVDLADELGLRLAVSQNYRHYPGVATLMGLVRDGALGGVRSVSARFWCDWKGKPYQHGMDHVMALEMAVHHFDLARAIFAAEAVAGHVAEWNPATSPYASGAGVDAVFTMERADGAFPFHYSGSLVGRAPRTPWGGLWRIEFDDATVLIDHAPDATAPDADARGTGAPAREPVPGYGIYLCRPDGAPIEWLGPFAADTMMLDASFEDFASAVREAREPWSSARDNLGTMRMVLGFTAPVPRTAGGAAGATP